MVTRVKVLLVKMYIFGLTFRSCYKLPHKHHKLINKDIPVRMGWRQKLTDAASKKGFDALFKLFDKDMSGELDPKELSELLTVAIKQAGGAFTVSEAQVSMLVKAADADHDGNLSKDEVQKIYNEFVNNIQQYVPQ